MNRLFLFKRMEQPGGKKRGAVMAMTVVSIAVVFGFTALAVDIGHLYVVKGELQRASDAASMAGVSALVDPGSINNNISESERSMEAENRAIEYAEENKACGRSVQIDPSDVTVGYIDDANDLQEPISIGSYNNAVRVVARDSAVSLFFAGIWGKRTATVSATSTAFYDSHMSGYQPPSESGGAAVPITVFIQQWINDIVNQGGQDNYGYDTDTGQITSGPDGIPEITIYPEHQNNIEDGDDGSSDGAGNFGVLNINVPNSGAVTVGDQIRNGLTRDDFIGELGTPTVTFFDEQGNPQTLAIGGTPGLMASLKDDFESRLGDVIGFFTHTEIDLQGSSAEYTITNMQFGRLLDVTLTGNNKVIVVQPVSYTGSGIVTDEDVPVHPTGGRIRLVR